MNVFYAKRGLLGQRPGVNYLEASRLHIGWNEEDLKMWDEFPFLGEDGKLAYSGGAVLAIHDNPGSIRILIIKSHTGKKNERIGQVRVVDDNHTTEVIIDNPVASYSPRPRGLFDRLRRFFDD